MRVTVPMSAGDLIDKITILRIKAANIPDKTKLANVRRELKALREVREGRQILCTRQVRAKERQLYAENLDLWNTENRLRALEAKSSFGKTFVTAARRVYKSNYRRASLKREIDELVGSEWREEKWYPAE